MQHNQNESRNSTNDDSHSASQRQIPAASNNRSGNERVDDSPSIPDPAPAPSESATQRQEPAISHDRQENDRVIVSHSRPDNSTRSSHNATLRQVPVTGGGRSENEQAKYTQPRTGNTTARENTATGVAQEVPARHDGSVHHGSLHQPEKIVYNSPRKSNGPREIMYTYQQPPQSKEYRSQHRPYRKPVHGSIFWTPEMRIEYENIYPMVEYWDYPEGYWIETISAYDALYYCGEVVTVYGKVEEVFYSRPTDEYILYFGAYYPCHDFTVVIPGKIARRFSYRPERYFEYACVMVTGLVTMYDGVPEVYINRTYQIDIY
jgi:hypothetical protein